MFHHCFQSNLIASNKMRQQHRKIDHWEAKYAWIAYNLLIHGETYFYLPPSSPSLSRYLKISTMIRSQPSNNCEEMNEEVSSRLSYLFAVSRSTPPDDWCPKITKKSNFTESTVIHLQVVQLSLFLGIVCGWNWGCFCCLLTRPKYLLHSSRSCSMEKRCQIRLVSIQLVLGRMIYSCLCLHVLPPDLPLGKRLFY